jgi:hypothetical protein
MIDGRTWAALPPRFEGRAYHAHNRLIASLAATDDEKRALAAEIGARLGQVRWPDPACPDPRPRWTVAPGRRDSVHAQRNATGCSLSRCTRREVERTPSLVRMLRNWWSTVDSERSSRRAISL